VSKVSFSASPYKYPFPTLFKADIFPAFEVPNFGMLFNQSRFFT